MIRMRTMRRVPRNVLIVAVFTTAAGTGGGACGSHTSQTIDAAFRNRVNTICSAAATDHARHPFPLTSFDPLHPDPSQLPRVADYFARYGEGAQLAEQLTALGEPTQGRSEWNSLITLVNEATVNGQDQVAAARDQDVQQFVSLVRSAQRIHNQIVKAGTQVGFSASSPCVDVY